MTISGRTVSTRTQMMVGLFITLGLLVMTECISFEALYEKELKTTYGFEVLKHYHSEQFGNETVKKFKG